MRPPWGVCTFFIYTTIDIGEHTLLGERQIEGQAGESLGDNVGPADGRKCMELKDAHGNMPPALAASLLDI